MFLRIGKILIQRKVAASEIAANTEHKRKDINALSSVGKIDNKNGKL
jgi:hypothetical protein